MQHDSRHQPRPAPSATTALTRWGCTALVCFVLVGVFLHMFTLFRNGDAALTAIFYVWPATILAIWLVVVTPLATVRRWRNVGAWTLLCAGALVDYPLLALNSGTGNGDTTDIILEGMLLAFDSAVIYGCWRCLY